MIKQVVDDVCKKRVKKRERDIRYRKSDSFARKRSPLSSNFDWDAAAAWLKTHGVAPSTIKNYQSIHKLWVDLVTEHTSGIIPPAEGILYLLNHAEIVGEWLETGSAALSGSIDEAAEGQVSVADG